MVVVVVACGGGGGGNGGGGGGGDGKNQYVLIHPTQLTTNLFRLYKDPPVLTEGQVAFERVKTSVNIENYVLYTYAESLLNKLNVLHILTSWKEFQTQMTVFSRRSDLQHLFEMWRESLCSILFSRLTEMQELKNRHGGGEG